jgi:hypothetical protein
MPNMMPYPPFDEHIVGDAECPACWRGPIPCAHGGLIHTTWSAMKSGQYDLHSLTRRCDICDNTAGPELYPHSKHA